MVVVLFYNSPTLLRCTLVQTFTHVYLTLVCKKKSKSPVVRLTEIFFKCDNVHENMTVYMYCCVKYSFVQPRTMLLKLAVPFIINSILNIPFAANKFNINNLLYDMRNYVSQTILLLEVRNVKTLRLFRR